MRGFDYKNGEWVCRNCGSKKVCIKTGYLVDRAWCEDCGNEDYL